MRPWTYRKQWSSRWLAQLVAAIEYRSQRVLSGLPPWEPSENDFGNCSSIRSGGCVVCELGIVGARPAGGARRLQWPKCRAARRTARPLLPRSGPPPPPKPRWIPGLLNSTKAGAKSPCHGSDRVLWALPMPPWRVSTLLTRRARSTRGCYEAASASARWWGCTLFPRAAATAQSLSRTAASAQSLPRRIHVPTPALHSQTQPKPDAPLQRYIHLNIAPLSSVFLTEFVFTLLSWIVDPVTL